MIRQGNELRSVFEVDISKLPTLKEWRELTKKKGFTQRERFQDSMLPKDIKELKNLPDMEKETD